MLPNSPIKNVYLIGICGTAMASLAGMLKVSGYMVNGSDQNVYPPMSEFLGNLGIPIHTGYSEAHLNPRPDLVIVGNAISRGNPEVEHTLNAKIWYSSLSEVLKEFFIRGKKSVVVAGTHGKTTVTSLLAWLLEHAGWDPSFLVGGIAENFGSSFKLGKGGIFVIEGDEYDTAYFDKGPKFLHYLPDWVIFNNCEFDHADIYAGLEAVKTSFRRLINIIPSGGCLIAGWDDPVVRELSAASFCPIKSFGLDIESDWTAAAVRHFEHLTRFEVKYGGELWGEIDVPLSGLFNVKNTLAALACAHGLGVEKESLIEGIKKFRNVKRRLEIRGQVQGIMVFDDFAHHPTAIRETLKAVKTRYPDSRVWAIFEPRSATSRRNIFQKDFADALQVADRVVLCTPFAAEKLDPLIRLDVNRIVEDLIGRGVLAATWNSADEIVTKVAPQLTAGDKVVIMSNGGFGGIHSKLIQALEARQEQQQY